MAIIGQPINRIDGPLKVSGRATYAYEHWDVGQPLYGFIVGATIGKGRVAKIDTARAERSPGVRMVMTHRNAPAQGTPDASIPSQYSRAQPVLNGDKFSAAHGERFRVEISSARVVERGAGPEDAVGIEPPVADPREGGHQRTGLVEDLGR